MARQYSHSSDGTFRTYDDLNGVDTSCNSHDEIEYEPPVSTLKPVEPRYRYNQQGNFEQVPPPDSLVERTRDRMLNVLGTGRQGAMSFEGDSLPRSERLPIDHRTTERADGLPPRAPSAEAEAAKAEKAEATRATRPQRRY